MMKHCAYPTYRTLAVIVLLGWAGHAMSSFGQAPDPGKYSAEQFDVNATRGHKAPMRDGVRLSVDVFQPQAEGRFPAILIITPYSNNQGYRTRGTWFARRGYAKITVPSLAASGWFDADFPGTPQNYVAIKQYGATPVARQPRLVIGPWPHIFNRNRKVGPFDYGPEALIDWDGYVCRWFDHFLKGLDNGVMNDPPVHVFVMGRNRWSAERDWPLPQTRWTKYYLHSGGHANSIGGDGVLSTAPFGADDACGAPAGDGKTAPQTGRALAAAYDSYRYDPAKPTPSPFPNNQMDDGAVDTRKSSSGPDVLVYTTPPLEEEVEVTGPITAVLYAATTARDTDWIVRLVDVRPDGYAALLCEGLLRARHRDPRQSGRFNPERLSIIEPNEVCPYTIDFWRATANVFAKGHRIRVEISSSYFPYYLRNPNTGADNIGLETRSVVADQKLWHTTKYPSHVVLPVIPRR